MNITEAIKILENHNRWRRGGVSTSLQNPVDLGIAIDIAIQELKALERSCECNKQEDNEISV